MTFARMHLRIAGSLAAALVLWLSGCATQDAPALDVALANVSLIDVQPLEQRFLLTLRFTNRTGRDVAVDGLTYRLDINGREFASGVSSQAFTVPRYGETRIDATATSSLSGVLAQIEELQKRAASPAGAAPLSYRLTGRASTGYFGTAFDTQSDLPFPTVAH